VIRMIEIIVDGKKYEFKDDITVDVFEKLGEATSPDFEKKFIVAMSKKPLFTLDEIKQLPLKTYRKLRDEINKIYLADFREPQE